MKNNIYGIFGVGLKNAMWNADFDKQAKKNGLDIIKGSSYAFQFCLKKQWDRLNYKVLGIKTLQENGVCNKIEERYNNLFNEGKKDKKDFKITLNNLLQCKDVLHFGVAYTATPNVNIQGLLQLSEGVNLFQDTHESEETIITPYANSNKQDKQTTTIGSRILLDEAHFIYDFSLFPKEYDKYISDGFKGYTREDYEDFKKQSIICVSNYNSKAKAGCKNEFALFVETKEETNYQVDLNCLQDYVSIKKNKEDIITYDLKTLSELLNSLVAKIDSIEIYYNPRTVEIKNMKRNNVTKIYDLITREEI